VTWTGERAGNGGWGVWGGHDGWGCVVYSSIGGGGELGTKGVRGWNLLGFLIAFSMNDSYFM